MNKRIVIMAVGGQGNLLISRILGEAAIRSDIGVQISEVHGMAQRGGVVETDVLLGNIKSSTVAPGEADVLLAFEPIEAMRAINKCNKYSIIISNSEPILPFSVTSNNAKYPNINELWDIARSRVKELVTVNAAELAKKAGAAMSLNMVMLGVLVKKGDLPLSEAVLKETIMARTKPSFIEINLKAFELGKLSVN